MLQACEKTEASAVSEKNSNERICTEIQTNLTNLRSEFEELTQSVAEKLQPLGITELVASEVTSIRTLLASRLNTWQEQTTRKTDIEKRIDSIDSEVKRLEAVNSTQEKALETKKKRLDDLKQQYTNGLDERKTLYGDTKPDEEEIRLTTEVDHAEAAEKRHRDLHYNLQQKLTTAKSHVESRKKRIAQRTPELEETEKSFLQALYSSSFTDEHSFKEARLSYEERESLSKRARELDTEETELNTKLKDRKNRLDIEQAKKLSATSYDDLQEQASTYEDSLKKVRDEISTCKYTLHRNKEAKERLKDKQESIEAQTRLCARWSNLHDLIGSADGKKYRTFAQGLTFELMVGHANRQLEKMTDRYLLIRDDSQPLELNVVDNYQAGEIRSTRNLSGGESFIVSLTLALGLSQMASKKVRVDSLFLDEGFGTLDEETLETALESLSALQQEGKLIGIISHVSALKERISTQISITPLSGGRSMLSGPGCTKC
jgi:exonuclease SbcC